MSLEQIDTLVAGERFEAAGKLIAEELERTEPDQELRWRLQLRQVERWLTSYEQPVDEAIFLAEDLLFPAGKSHTEELPRVHAALIRAYTRKRCAELARRAIEQARSEVQEAVEVLVAEGTLALEFDDRERAKEVYARALELHPQSSLAKLATANLRYVLGDFDGCQQHLDAVGVGDACWSRGTRLRASSYAAAHDYANEAEQWRQLVERLPEGDYAQDDRVALALALASDGRQEEALEQFRVAWRSDPESRAGCYARERIEHLEQAPKGTVRKRLATFPTTQQKWNYCGPAVLELCLRHLNIDLGQDEIAQRVKRTTGTPMFEMVQYLQERGVVARRIEAVPPRLRAAIDLGLPVIVQEEYSTTSHVAVITGYDEALGLFIANDPMTHRQMLRSFRWTERAGSMYGNGGLVVLGREGPELKPLLDRADEANLVEARHLVILDECDRRRSRPASADMEDATLEQVIQLAAEALRLNPSFKLAHYRLWHAENHLYQISGRPHLRDQVLDRLHRIRTVFPEDEWPHQLHGHWLIDNARYEEAFVAYFEASRRDPGDANNLQTMGECKWLAGDLADAERYMLEALAVEPFHVRAAENLAGVYLRQLEEVDRSQRESSRQDPVDELTAMVPRRLSRQIERSPEVIARRAWHFNRVACAVAAGNPYNQEVAGALCRREGKLEQGIAAYRRAREITPDRQGALFGLARALEGAGQLEEVRTLLEEGCERFWREPLAWCAAAAFLRRQDKAGEALALLQRGLGTLASGHTVLARPYFETLRQLESTEAAAARLRDLAEQRISDEDLLREVAYLLDEHGQRGHAIALLRQVLARSPFDVNAIYRLGSLLSEDLLTRQEGRDLLERVVELAPDAAVPRRQLAWLLRQDEPQLGLDLLASVLDQEDPYVYETQSALLAAVGREEEAAVAFQLALEAHGAFGPGLVDLCAWHLRAKRYDRALVLARQIFEHPLPEGLEEDAWYFWLQAHRMAGAFREAMPRLQQLCADGVPEALAWEVYWGCRSIDHKLAAEAAESYADQADDEQERLEWLIKAAGHRAHLGDEGPLEQARQEVGEDPQLWAELCWAYEDLDRYDEANAAARRAYEIDPSDRCALTVMEETYVRLNQPDRALECARRLCELHPYEHQGPERLGILLSKLFQVEEALDQSLHAVDAAPYCHISHRSRALALFVAAQLELAEQHARQSLALDEPEEEDASDDALMLVRAIEGDVEGLQRCLDKLAREEPPEVFARFKEHLLEVARRRAPSAPPG